jgi:hypothetical protein
VLAVESDEVEVELSGSLALGILKDNSEVRSILISLEGNGVVVVG